MKRQNEYNQLAAALYTTEGGRFAEHTGKAPVWIDNRDPSRSRNHNIKVAGSGEIGEIMLDFEWNDMKEKQGWAEVALPMWEKKLWNSSSAPTLRAVADVASNIASAVVAAVPGGAAVAPFVALTDDLLMAGLDYGLGYKDGMDVSKELGRKAAVTAISTYTGAKFAGMSNHVLQTATISSINTTASTAVYSTSLSDFRNSISTYSTWNSTVTSTIGAGVTSALGKIDLRDGNAHNLASNTFDTKNIAAFNSKVGDLTAAALDYKLTGTTTFNVLDVADLGLSVINKRAKEDGSGGFIDSITGEKTTKKIGVHKGILELTIGGDNSGLHLGSGGYNISYGTIASTVAGLTEAAKVADWKYSSIEKSSTLNSINMLSYTTAGENDNKKLAEDNHNLAKEIWNGEKKVEYIDTSAGVQGTQNSKDTIYISNTLLGGENEGAGQRASILSHENVHIKEHKENKGYDEFQARLAGYETYADLQQSFGLTGAGYENVTDIAYMTDYYKQYGQEGVFTKLFFGDAFAKENKENYFARNGGTGWYQRGNISEKDIALAMGYDEEAVKKINQKTRELLYNKYINGLKNEKPVDFETFLTDENVLNILKKEELTYDSIYSAGCTMATAAYFAYDLSGNLYSFSEVNDLLKSEDTKARAENNIEKTIFSEDANNGNQLNLIGVGNQYANAVNALAGFKAIDNKAMSFVSGNGSIANALSFYNDIPKQEYISHVRISSAVDPVKYPNAHSTIFQGLNYTYNGTDSNPIVSINVLDPISGLKTIDINRVYRADVYKVLERRNYNNFVKLPNNSYGLRYSMGERK